MVGPSLTTATLQALADASGVTVVYVQRCCDEPTTAIDGNVFDAAQFKRELQVVALMSRWDSSKNRPPRPTENPPTPRAKLWGRTSVDKRRLKARLLHPVGFA